MSLGVTKCMRGGGGREDIKEGERWWRKGEGEWKGGDREDERTGLRSAEKGRGR